MIIPLLNSQVNMLFGGPALPTGAQVTFGVDNSTGKSPSVIAGEVQTAWIDSLLQQQVTQITLLGVLVKNGPNDTGPSAQSTTASSGSIVGGGVPPNVSILVTKNTLQGGRQGRGRFFIPGANETGVDSGGVIESGYRGDIQTEADAFLAELDDLDLPMILLRSEDSPPDPPETVVSLTVASSVATQRRRLRR